MEKNLFSSFIFHLKKKGSGAILIGLLFFFLPFRIFCQQQDAIITVQNGATVYGEFYVAPVEGEASPAKSPSKVYIKEKNRSAAYPKFAREKTRSTKRAVKAPASLVNLRGSEEQFTFLQNFSLGKFSTPASQDSAKALLSKLLVVKPLFLIEKKQASALRGAVALFTNKFTTRGPPEFFNVF